MSRKRGKLSEDDFVVAVDYHLRKRKVLKDDAERRNAAARAAVRAYCEDNGCAVGDDSHPWNTDHARAIAAGWQDEA